MRPCPICNSKQHVSSQFTGYVRCSCCDMIYKDFQLISEFDESYWGKVKDPDGNVRDKAKEVKHKIDCNIDEIKFLNKTYPQGGKIIDIGAGLGHLLSGFQDKWDCYGVEISEYCQNFMTEHYPFIKQVKTEDIPDNYFDVIYSHHVIEHMENPMVELEESYRILKQGGHMIVVTPNIESWVARRFGDNFRLIKDETHINMFGESTLIEALEWSGFKTIKINKPFFRTKYFTLKNILRLINTNNVSPPFKGNVIYAYCKKPYEFAK